ncbi:hypothetical protein Gotur_032533 [Gossypium turneri]
MENFRKVLEDCQLLDGEDSCEVIIRKVWESESGDVLSKLVYLKVALWEWERNIKRKWDEEVKNLNNRLGLLLEAEKGDEMLVEIIGIKMQLNWEVGLDLGLMDTEVEGDALSNGERRRSLAGIEEQWCLRDGVPEFAREAVERDRRGLSCEGSLVTE